MSSSCDLSYRPDNAKASLVEIRHQQLRNVKIGVSDTRTTKHDIFVITLSREANVVSFKASGVIYKFG